MTKHYNLPYFSQKLFFNVKITKKLLGLQNAIRTINGIVDGFMIIPQRSLRASCEQAVLKFIITDF